MRGNMSWRLSRLEVQHQIGNGADDGRPKVTLSAFGDDLIMLTGTAASHQVHRLVCPRQCFDPGDAPSLDDPQWQGFCPEQRVWLRDVWLREIEERLDWVTGRKKEGLFCQEQDEGYSGRGEPWWRSVLQREALRTDKQREREATDCEDVDADSETVQEGD